MNDRVTLERAARANSERFTFQSDGFAISPGPFSMRRRLRSLPNMRGVF
jgi:hypothetical protein